MLSFLALNFFFTPPLHTFVVGTRDDLVALVVFLAVSIIVGLLVSAVVAESGRAEEREVRARLMSDLATHLLTGGALDDTLAMLAHRIAGLVGDARCAIRTEFGSSDQESSTAEAEPDLDIDIYVKQRVIGTMQLWATPPRERFDKAERIPLEQIGKQISLALESMRLSEDVRRAEIDARASEMKAALFSGVTHDVKTPLAAIMTAVTSLIEGENYSLDQREAHLATIHSEAERLHRVVSNMLELGRLRAGERHLRRAEGPIDEVIDSVIARLRPSLLERHIEIRVPADLPEVSMDVIQMDQVLTNLIENAIKFSPPGSPLSVSAIGGPSSIRVTVSDHGEGVPKEDRERIFEPFERGQSDGSGTGLGLAIARAIVLEHGGRIWVNDSPTRGAAFTFELPVIDPREASVTV